MSGNLPRFREDTTSYSRTGIPCGDPSRYDSRGVTRMAPSKRPFKSQNIEAPVEDIITEGERQLHELAVQQLEKNVFVDGKLTRKKNFVPSNVLNPTTAKVSGTLTVKDYKDLEDHDKHLEELRQCGLSQDEIELLLETDGVGLNGKPSKRSRFGIDPTAHATKLEQIQRKIAKKKSELKKPDTYVGARYMSRHELDLEKAISHNRDKAKLLGMLVTNVSDPVAEGDPNDPINNLDSIMDEVMEKERKITKGVKHKLTVATCEPRPEGYVSNEIDSGGTLCPLCRRPACIESDEKGQDLCTCDIMKKNQSATTDCVSPAGGPRKITGPVKSIAEEEIVQNRLGLHEIRKIERLKNYDPGHPTNVLYLKNLSSKVTEDDLISLFIRYQKEESPIRFKLLTGRMRGQAFVTFNNTDIATEALNLVNGYISKGKPIIIQYGRHNTA